jgi:hypothetical protein
LWYNTNSIKIKGERHDGKGFLHEMQDKEGDGEDEGCYNEE